MALEFKPIESFGAYTPLYVSPVFCFNKATSSSVKLTIDSEVYEPLSITFSFTKEMFWTSESINELTVVVYLLYALIVSASPNSVNATKDRIIEITNLTGFAFNPDAPILKLSLNGNRDFINLNFCFFS